MGPPAVPTAREGELRTKTRVSGNTEELTESTDEEKKEGWWFRVHTRYKFAGKRIACVMCGRPGKG